MIKGLDISEHNGVVDFNLLKTKGINFVMIRSSWGHFVEDKMLRRNVEECVKNGINYGLYHYSYAINETEAINEATNFLNLSKQFSGRTYPLCVDIEDADHYKSKNGFSIDSEISIIRQFKNIIEGDGQYLLLYMNRYYFDVLSKIDKVLIDSLDKWLAHWEIDSPSLNCGMWQSTSNYIINNKRFDFNYAYKDYPTVLSQMNKNNVNEKPKDIVVGSAVKVTTTIDFNGVKNDDWVLNTIFYVGSINNGRCVLYKDGALTQLTGAWKWSDLIAV